MKSIVLLLTLLTITDVYASDIVYLDQGDKSLGRAHVEIVDQSPICPRTPGMVSCLAFGSRVQLKITLNGCVDRLGPVFHHLAVQKHKAILYVGAVNIHNEASEVTKCIAAPTEFKTITVPYEGRMIIKNMAFEGEVLPAVDPIFEPSIERR